MAKNPSEDQYSDAETARRRDETVKRMIATPPTTHAPVKAKKKPKRARPKAKRGV